MVSAREIKMKIRQKMMAERYALSEHEKADAEKVMISKILSLTSFRFAKTILLYYPIKGEPDLRPLAKAAFLAGKQVAFPRCHTESCTITYHYVDSLDELTDGTYGTKEPFPNAPMYTPSQCQNDMIIVPGISFDINGYRLGYGKGYYDRFLSDFNGTQIGLTFHKLFVKELPRGRYDKRVHIILTEKGVFSAQ